MDWLLRFSFYTRTQISLFIFILLPLAIVSLLSYYLIKEVVIDKFHASNRSVVEVISSDLDKNVEDIIYASNLFASADSSSIGDLLAFKDVGSIDSSKDYFIYKRLSESMNLAFSKTSGLNAQVFFVNNSGFVVYAANNVLDFPALKGWMNGVLSGMAKDESLGGRVRWVKADSLKLYSSGETQGFYYAIKTIRDPSMKKKVGTLFVGVPVEYFEKLLSKDGGEGEFELLSEDGKTIYRYPARTESQAAGDWMEIREAVAKPGWELVYRYSSKAITAEISRMFRVYALILSLCVLAFLLISVLIARTLHRPLGKLRRTAERFGEGDRMLRFPVRGRDEVAVLGSAFNRMLDRINQLIVDVEQEQEEKRAIELQALFSQIRPHFLLNTLNSIKCNLATDGDAVNSKQIDALMSLLRAYMRVNENCTLAQECKLLGDYVEIMQMRSEIPVRLHVHIDESLESLEVPRLLLQPLVENAIVHGFAELPDDAAIWVRATEDGGYCRIEIEDNGAGMGREEREALARSAASDAEPQASNRRIGLANVYSRLRLTYGAGVSMDIAGNETGGVSVILRFPKR